MQIRKILTLYEIHVPLALKLRIQTQSSEVKSAVADIFWRNSELPALYGAKGIAYWKKVHTCLFPSPIKVL